MKLQLALIASLFATFQQVQADPVQVCTALMAEQSEVIASRTESGSDDSEFEYVDAGAWNNIFDACPEQVGQLLEHPWANLLARPAEELVLGDLAGLPQLETTYRQLQPGPLIGSAPLEGILEEIRQPPPAPPSLWQRLMEWLFDSLEDRDSDLPGWLEGLSVPEAVFSAIFYICVALIVLLALFIVGRELRHGLANRRKVADQGWDSGSPGAMGPPDFPDLAGIPLSEQPGLLLRIVLARLQASGILQLRSSFTHREITAATANIEQGETVGTISRAAERATFGGWQPAGEDIDQLLQSSREVCARLETKR